MYIIILSVLFVDNSERSLMMVVHWCHLVSKLELQLEHFSARLWEGGAVTKTHQTELSVRIEREHFLGKEYWPLSGHFIYLETYNLWVFAYSASFIRLNVFKFQPYCSMY